MKKKFLATILTLSLMGTMTTAMAFADESADPIQTGDQLKAAFAEHLKDGSLTEQERQMILDNAAEGAVEELMMEKLNAAAELLNDPAAEEIKSLPAGEDYAEYEVDLNDGCSLTVELADRSESSEYGIRTMANSGSSSPWKEYGNRYFTAKATVSCGTYKVTMSLENHYALSASGIVERYGKPGITPPEDKLITQKGNAEISKTSASSIGSSAGIYCTFSCKAESTTVQKYKMNTTVKYLAHNKTTKKIQVGQSWNLVKQ